MDNGDDISFVPYPKTPRLFRDIVVTEKIDGTNAQIVINANSDPEYIMAGSRNRWITPEQDNHGFADWVWENRVQLTEILGPGRHFGEWWGSGIQRRYGLDEKRFSLFNVLRWGQHHTKETRIGGLFYTVPILYSGVFSEEALGMVRDDLEINGSKANEGFFNPEGYIVYHKAGNHTYKVLLDNDEKSKEEVNSQIV